MGKQILLIGIDGGATKVSAWEIVYNERHSTFLLGTVSASKSYREISGYIPDFMPVDLNIQLNERDSEINLTEEEKQQAEVYVQACALAVEELVQKKRCRDVLIGIGMPGLKTVNKRGIAVVANGPRMLDYAQELEEKLMSRNIHLVSFINHLGSDADYCGIGENYSEEGLFRTVENAYYLGGGTGVADAMKLDGKLLTFDQSREWICKTWEMKSLEGLPLERVTSVSGMQRTYAEFAGKSVEELNIKEIYPLQIAALAKQGEAAAVKAFEVVNRNLARLLYERIVTLNAGWKGLFDFVNPNRPKLNGQHEFPGKVFDTIVIGQRLGDLFEDNIGNKIVKDTVIRQLDDLIQNSEFLSEGAKAHYSDLESVVKTSKLREAPALGAGIDAFLSKQF